MIMPCVNDNNLTSKAEVMTAPKTLQLEHELFLQNSNSWENGFYKCLSIKGLKIFHPFTNPNKLHWDSKFIYNADLKPIKQENSGWIDREPI